MPVDLEVNVPPKTPLTKHEMPPEDVMSFFEIDQASKALKDVDFSVHEEVRTLVELFRDTDPQVVLRAQTQLRKVLKDIASASGMIEKHEVTAISQEGNSVKLTRTASRVSAALPENKLNAIYQDKPTFAAEYLPPSDDSGEEGCDEGNPDDGPNGAGEIRGTDPIRFGD